MIGPDSTPPREETILTVILNYRTADMTLRSVEAALTAMAEIAGEIVIVDNDSQDSSFETLSDAVRDRGWSRVRVIQSGRNGGFGAGNNVGIRAGLSTGESPDFVYILNSDAFPAPDAIAKLLDRLRAHPEAGFAGSYIHGPDGDPHNTCFRFPSLASEFERAINFGPVSRLLKNRVTALPVPEETGKVDWLAGASVMMRRAVLDEIGLFDERFFLYFEETDLCRRLARTGREVHYVRDSEVAHIGSVSTGMKSWDRVPRYWFESRLHYFVKNHGAVYAASTTLAHVVGGGFNRLRRPFSRGTTLHTRPYFLIDLLRNDLGALLGAMTGRSRRS